MEGNLRVFGASKNFYIANTVDYLEINSALY